MPRVARFERFIFSSETSDLSDAEFRSIVEKLDQVASLVTHRERASGVEPASGLEPAANWSPSKRQTFELDGAVTNPFTSFQLVMRKDREILRKLRLYSQSFTGYQLATLAFANSRPWIRDRLPEDLDDRVRMLVHDSDPALEADRRLCQHLPAELRLSPPFKFGEMGWLVDGRLVNVDTYMYLERFALLHEAGLLDRLRRIARERTVLILEIGGGFGALAYHLVRLVGNARYVIVDIPESLAFSVPYLTTLLPGGEHQLWGPEGTRDIPARPGVSFVSNQLAGALRAWGGSFDLAINTLSLAEMTPAQVRSYAGLLRDRLSPEGTFFEQNFPRFSDPVPGDAVLVHEVLRTALEGPEPCPASHFPKDAAGRPQLWNGVPSLWRVPR